MKAYHYEGWSYRRTLNANRKIEIIAASEENHHIKNVYIPI
jgi:hypothetical protein